MIRCYLYGKNNRSSLVLIVASTLAISLSGCSWVGLSEVELFQEHEPTLADLSPAVMPNKEIPLPKIDLDVLTKNYLDVMKTSQDADVQVQVMQRLAGLDMLKGELQLAEGQPSTDTLQLAIQAYQKLLNDYPDQPNNDRLMYQLSKAYDLKGQLDLSLQALTRLVDRYPNSIHTIEAEFRRAEMYFSRSDYTRAEKSYAVVIAAGDNSDYYQNALYMHGWSQFKRDRYRSGLISFSKMLDQLIPADNNLESLSRAQQELVSDTFRVMSVSFTYLEGPSTLNDLFKSQLGERHYLPLLYDHLGQLYLSLERYRDSADAYRAFVQTYPNAIQAPAFHGKLIKVFEKGNFSEQVLEEKENYVERYGVKSQYWNTGGKDLQDQIKPYLSQYLKELAQYHHAMAQKLLSKQKKQSSKHKTSKNSRYQQQQEQQLKAKTQQHFIRAGDYYQAFVDSFPQDKAVAEMLFLLAESRYEAGRYHQAISAYETVAYQYPEDKRAADAGYAAVLAYQYVLQAGPNKNQQQQQQKIESALRFSEHFKQDSRASSVLAQAAEELLGLQSYAQARDAASKLVEWSKPLPKHLQRITWVVIGHSEFELQQYSIAEMAFQKALPVTEDKKQRQQIEEKLAASIYKQAEGLVAEGESQAAAEQFLRVLEAAPQSSIVVNAQYDAAVNFMAARQWQSAIKQWQLFRTQYPQHELASSISAQLIKAYQETKQWQLAAAELYQVSQNETDKEAKRQALYGSAELYEKSGNKETAIIHFRSYAHSYPEPFNQVMEARYRLSELYQQTGQEKKRRFWLNKMIAGENRAASNSTERSRYLAALSQSVLAEDAYQAFQSVKLKQPLKKSLKKKKSTLNRALKAYQKSIDYGVQEFATLGTYKIAEIYAGLSRDLLSAKPPSNLDALALEQYQLLLEEQAFPFEEKAIELHEANTQRSWKGVYDQGVKNSFLALELLLPARYKKREIRLGVSSEIY